MTRDELIQLIAEVRLHNSELEDVEVKLAKGGTPKRMFESLSAFANHTGGGIVILGLDQDMGFEVAGVGDAHRLLAEEDI